MSAQEDPLASQQDRLPEVVSDAFVSQVRTALENKKNAALEDLMAPLVAADVALLLERLPNDDRHTLVDHLKDAFDPLILADLSQAIMMPVVRQLGIPYIAALLPELSSDDAFTLIEELDEKEQRELLSTIPRANRRSYEKISAYPEDSAARIMQQEVVIIPSFWTIGAVIQYIQRADTLPEEFYEVYVVNPRHEPVGRVSLNQLLRCKPDTSVDAIMEEDFHTVNTITNQEEVAYIFRHYDLVSAPVVDEGGRIIGMITADDVVDVIDEESQREIMQLTGVDNSEFNAPIFETSYHRVAGLTVTFINSFILVLVVYSFENIIAHNVMLVALMPIVAGMSGASGTQVFAITVRALSNKLIRPNNVVQTIWREVVVGCLNGLIFSVILMFILMLWHHDLMLGAILVTALIFNMTWAALGGVALPIIVDRLGLDPAISTGPVLTATTDVIGFVSLLALAKVLL